MATPTISVVIASRGRPENLIRCLSGIDGLIYPAFEVVVVACPLGCAALEQSRLAERVKIVPFDEANLSAARNLGIEAAAGEIIAFIDDDSVAEPTWLRFLVEPFNAPDIAAAGGFVRGRNGISFQWKAREVDACGRESALVVDETTFSTPDPAPGKAIKTEGTNMAVRRSVLAELGGFDESYRFFLDETDLNMRLQRAGWRTAIAPLAQVHHASAASERRKQDRTVIDLSEIGASTMVFLRRHAPEEEHGARLNEVLLEQKMRVFDQLRAGKLQKHEAEPILTGFRAGIEAGRDRELALLEPISAPSAAFQPFQPARDGSAILSGRIWQAKRLRREAARRADAGATVSLFILGPSIRRHKVRFSNGVWEQNGGLFGRSDRTGPWFRIVGFARRLKQECARVGKTRGLTED